VQKVIIIADSWNEDTSAISRTLSPRSENLAVKKSLKFGMGDGILIFRRRRSRRRKFSVLNK